jgi:hypothetical protein
MKGSDPKVGIEIALLKSADHFSRKVKERIAQNNLPNVISDSVVIDSPVTSSDGAYIDITINADNSAPMAGAFEYGSGIWAERGTRDRYPILPRNASFLAFEWEQAGAGSLSPSHLQDIGVNARGGIELTAGGKAILPGVMHPGVQARPYIRPTIVSEREEIKRIIGQEFRASISLGGVTEIIE